MPGAVEDALGRVAANAAVGPVVVVLGKSFDPVGGVVNIVKMVRIVRHALHGPGPRKVDTVGVKLLALL